MTTNNGVAQPVAGVERRSAFYEPVPIPEDTPERIYIRARYASDVMGGVYHLERNERDMIEYTRTPADVQERARRAASAILSSVSVNEFRQVQDYDRWQRLAAIIAAEFGGEMR